MNLASPQSTGVSRASTHWEAAGCSFVCWFIICAEKKNEKKYTCSFYIVRRKRLQNSDIEKPTEYNRRKETN